VKRPVLFLSALAALASLAPGAAGACDPAYAAYTCDGGMAAPYCQIVGGMNQILECDLLRNPGVAPAGDAEARAASGTSGADFSVWGEDPWGVPFCCEAVVADFGSATIEVVLLGGPGDDHLRLNDHWGTTAAPFDLVPRGGVQLTGRIDGRAGDDEIYGSSCVDLNYVDNLVGGPGDDLMYGYDGDDLMFGGVGQDEMRGNEGADSMWGGPDDDTMYGMEGDDSMYGELGADYLSGGDGPDSLSGGPGDDQLRGHDGADSVCGDAGADTLEGSAGDDALWGDPLDVLLDGDADYDACSPFFSPAAVSCETGLAGRPCY